MVKYLTGRAKDLVMLKMLKSKAVRNMDRKFLYYLRESSKYEKFVQIDGKVVMNSQLPPYGTEAFEKFISMIPRIQNGEKFPFSVNIAITSRCNYDCWHCSNWGREEKPDMTLEVLTNAIHKLQDMGNCFIGITGGEPTLRDDLEEIVEAIGTRSHTILFTNGEKLSMERAKGLKERGLFSASVSLDHFKPEIHDKQRGFAGAFDIAVAAIKACNDAGLYTIAGAVPTREMINNGEIPRYYRFLKDIGAHEVRIIAPIPTGRLVGNKDARWCGKDEEKQMWEYHMQLNKDKDYPKISEYSYIESEGMLGCMAGTYHAFIEGDGTLTPCDMVPLSFGNIQKEGLEASYKSMSDRFQVPRYECYVRTAHALFKKGFDKEGKFPLSNETAMEITDKVKNKRMSAFFIKLGMPPPVFEESSTVEDKYESLDLKDLDCPEPVWRTQEKIWDMKSGTLDVLVNHIDAKDNVEKAARSEGWLYETKVLADGEFLITLTSS